MSDIDLDAMDLKDLKKLRKAVDRAIQDYQERKQAQARNAAEAAAREFGFSLEELVASKGTKKGRPTSPAKYRNPDDPAQTWSGRGRQPQWMREALENGADREDFLIERFDGGHAAG
ncbi:MAG: H-NS histone family protein [Limimaricola soesokkakensis]|uniref:H-NS histone family protein n=1 Tax=Limimaricola soesokkakensis TaxID=1343159 RepID=UPI004057CFFF